MLLHVFTEVRAPRICAWHRIRYRLWLYFAVDWALACDTLPDPKKSAKDMGLFHIALTFPQALLPLFGGALIDYLNKNVNPNIGYRVVFASAVVFLFLGTVLVSRIKSVR